MISLTVPKKLMQCFIYRSPRKPETFLFIPEKGDFSQLPEDLLRVFGEPEFSFEFPLTADRKMINGDAGEILERMEAQGFYLQLPVDRDARDND